MAQDPKKRRAYKSAGRQHISVIPKGEMDVLLTLWRHSGALPTAELCRAVGTVTSSAYMVLCRLTKRGLISSRYGARVAVDGRPLNGAVRVLTAKGKRLAREYAGFLRRIGPELRKLVGWP